MMTFRRYCVIVNHVIGEDTSRFELYFEVSGGRGFVRRDGSTRGRRAGGR
jgi:hypothetical protein